jgi:hypothetical protein
MDMNVINMPTKKALNKSQKNKVMKLEMRVKAILHAINEQCWPQVMPTSLVRFLSHLCEAKQFMPNNFLSSYEISRIGLDNYGALPRKMGVGKEHLIIGSYLISKVLIGLILLQEEIFAGNFKPAKISKIKQNLILIATVLQYILK